MHIIGEETNTLIAYLAGVSRKLERPLAIIIQSASAAGKTTLMDAVLSFFPEEERVKYSAMTGQSLYYLGETNLKHKILAGAEEAGAEEATIHNARLYIGRFIDWLAERGVLNAQDVTRPMLERYQRVLFHHRKQDGAPLSFAGQHVRLTTIQGFFKWLCRKYYITANPAADLELPKVEKRLPRQVLTAHEAEQILSQPDLSTPVGIRDRALLEILYSTGMRRKELTGLRSMTSTWNAAR